MKACSGNMWIAFTLVALLVDFITSSILLIHGNDLSLFGTQVTDYKFCSSSFDLLLISLLRLVLGLGSVLGLLFNRRDAVPRLASSTKLILYLSAGLIVFVVVKFLLSTECKMNHTSKVFYWTLSVWTIVCSATMNLYWYKLSKLSCVKRRNNLSTEEEIGSVLERERLLEESSSESDDAEDHRGMKKKKGKKSDDDLKVSVWKLLSYSKPDFLYIALALVFLIGTAAAEIFIPFYTGLVIDSIAIEKDRSKFLYSILIMTLISLVASIAAGLRGGIFTFVMARFNIRINNHLFNSLLKQEIGFFDNTKTGDIISRLTSDTTKMSDEVSLNVNVFLRNVIKGIGICVFMFKLSWQLSVLTLITIPIIAFVSEIYGKYYRKLSKAVQDAVSAANQIAAEVMSSMKTVRSFANEDGEFRSFKKKQHGVFKLKVKEAVLFGGYRCCTEILELALDVLTLYYGGHLVLNNILSAGNLVSFILYQLELAMCIEEIGDVYTGLMEAVGASEKVFEYIDRETQIPNNGSIAPRNFRGEIEFQNVSFAYPSRPEVKVMDDVSFKVKPGEVVALVGPSGGGKTTCINLLEHFYEPAEGQVLIDDIPIKELDHKYLHTKLALVGQEPVLFARSVKENIAYGLAEDSADEDIVENAARLANAYDFVSSMPEGFETETGEKGLQLSGGQKQRIAIARALIRSPGILLLDEATSALDAESEHIVQAAIYSSFQDRTVVIIAHRLSTVEKADRIVVIGRGKVLEQGTHAELFAQNGVYARLVQRQMLGTDSQSQSGSIPTSSIRQKKKSNASNSDSSLSSSVSSSSSNDDRGGGIPRF